MLKSDRFYFSKFAADPEMENQFVTDPEKMEVNLDDPYLLLHEKKISNMKDLLPLLEEVAEKGQAMLIISEDVDGEALATLVVYKLRGTLKVAAVEEGIVAGGGVALVRCLNALDNLDVTGEEKNGTEVLKRALGEPLRLIAKNAGCEGSVALIKVKRGKDDFGFNAETEKYENLMAAGVIDPTKVVRLALQNAASVAGLMITTEALISEKPERKSKQPPMPQMDEDMY